MRAMAHRYLLPGVKDAAAATGLPAAACEKLFNLAPDAKTEADCLPELAGTNGVLFTSKAALEAFGIPEPRKEGAAKAKAEEGKWMILGKTQHVRGAFAAKGNPFWQQLVDHEAAKDKAAEPKPEVEPEKDYGGDTRSEAAIDAGG